MRGFVDEKDIADGVYVCLIFATWNCPVFPDITGTEKKNWTGGGYDAGTVSYSARYRDVIVLGSSHGYMGIDQNLLWDEFGIPSFAMCSSSQPPSASYYILKEILKYHKPKVVLLELYTFYHDGRDFLEEKDHVQLRKAFDALRLDEYKLDMVKDFFPDAPWQEKMQWYIPFLRYHSRWNELTSYDFDPMYFLRGSKVSYRVTPSEQPLMTDETAELFEYNMAYFEKLRSLCLENGIKLVTFTTPITL